MTTNTDASEVTLEGSSSRYSYSVSLTKSGISGRDAAFSIKLFDLQTQTYVNLPPGTDSGTLTSGDITITK